VSSPAQEIFKISADGKMLLRFGRREPTDNNNNPSDAPRAQRSRQHVESPSDVALDRRGNVFVTDAGERPRIIKFDSRGRFLASTGGKGSRPGDLDRPHSMATDANGNVYVADSGNARIQVFDNSLNLRAVYHSIGTPWAICTTKGSREFLYSASNPTRVTARVVLQKSTNSSSTARFSVKL
jgi:sugar lactone lactonase YvrE